MTRSGFPWLVRTLRGCRKVVAVLPARLLGAPSQPVFRPAGLKSPLTTYGVFCGNRMPFE
jgi:hypothetical protein